MASRSFGALLALVAIAPATPKPFESRPDTVLSAKKALLDVVPTMPYGAPATNATISAKDALLIETAAARLEALSPVEHLAALTAPDGSPAINGSWRLIYSTAGEITRLTRLPAGFKLGPVYQPIDLAQLRFENQATVLHPWNLASATARVVADLAVAPLGSVSAVGLPNTNDNRVEVDFRRVVFEVNTLVPGFGFTRVVAPKRTPGRQKQSVDVTYLDDALRVARGGKGSLFVLTREESPTPMLRGEARELLVRDESAEAVQDGAGLTNWSQGTNWGLDRQASNSLPRFSLPRFSLPRFSLPHFSTLLNVFPPIRDKAHSHCHSSHPYFPPRAFPHVHIYPRFSSPRFSSPPTFDRSRLATGGNRCRPPPSATCTCVAHSWVGRSRAASSGSTAICSVAPRSHRPRRRWEVMAPRRAASG